jgi:hypothetical protein
MTSRTVPERKGHAMKPSEARRLAQAKHEIETVEKYLREGFAPAVPKGRKVLSAVTTAGRDLGEGRLAFADRIGTPKTAGMWEREFGLKPDWSLWKDPADSPFAVDSAPPPSYISGQAMTLVSRPDNTFLFGGAGDLHAGSKYCRWDVRDDLYRQFISAGAQCNFDTGNWLEGEANFNRYDIDAHGLDMQCKVLADKHPRGLATYAVWGDDHEGWYVQRDGIDVGRYAESVMREAGHEWTNLGYMEAHVLLKNANSGKSVAMTVAHPGGGSAYATSYSIQKIIESYEGGEKPAVGLYGHYHKLWAGLIRNVWCVQTGTGCDQTPFMRKKKIEAHVGGTLIKLRQDPRTGAILSMTPELIRYFNREWYAGTGRWSKHAEPKMLPRVPEQAQAPKRSAKRRRK